MNSSSSHNRRITDIRDQVRDPERVSLFIDGEFRLGLPRIVVAERNIYVGQHLSDAEIQELEKIDEISRATNQAVRLLSFRPRSRRELETRLKKNGYGSEAIAAAIERMVELGYIDDVDFASYWVENRQQHRPRGRRLLASELRSKGVPPDIVDQAIEEAEIDEYAQALELAVRRAERLRGLDRETWRRRLAGFLQRRGYGWDVVRPVLDDVESAEFYDQHD
jgi:regulatory protein